MKKSIKNRKKSNLEKSYLQAFRYISESRNYIYYIIGLFVLSAVFGFLAYKQLSFLDEVIKKLIEQALDLSGFRLVLFIFFNNLQSAFFGLLLGVVFGIFSIMNSFVNGMLLGYVAAKVSTVSGFSEFWRLLPHGIFELPAIFISLGLGVKLGMFVFSKNKVKELKMRFWSSINVFFLVVLPLLLLAAIIEGTLITLLR